MHEVALRLTAHQAELLQRISTIESRLAELSGRASVPQQDGSVYLDNGLTYNGTNITLCPVKSLQASHSLRTIVRRRIETMHACSNQYQRPP